MSWLTSTNQFDDGSDTSYLTSPDVTNADEMERFRKKLFLKNKDCLPETILNHRPYNGYFYERREYEWKPDIQKYKPRKTLEYQVQQLGNRTIYWCHESLFHAVGVRKLYLIHNYWFDKMEENENNSSIVIL